MACSYLPAEIQQQDRDGGLAKAKEERPTEEVPPFWTNERALPRIFEPIAWIAQSDNRNLRVS